MMVPCREIKSRYCQQTAHSLFSYKTVKDRQNQINYMQKYCQWKPVSAYFDKQIIMLGFPQYMRDKEIIRTGL
jgi:hypothetical protein